MGAMTAERRVPYFNIYMKVIKHVIQPLDISVDLTLRSPFYLLLDAPNMILYLEVCFHLV